MSKVDDRGRLLGGKPIPIKEGLKLYPFKLGEIVEFGYSEYMKCVNILIFDIDDVKKNVEENIKDYFDNITFYDYIISSCSQSKEFRTEYTNAMSLFLSDEVEFDEYQGKIRAKKFSINIESDDLDTIRKYLKLQNCLFDKKEEETEIQYNVVDSDLAKKMLERIKKENEKTNKLKERDANLNKENEIDIFDIISSISVSVTSLNIIEIWDLSFYQIYNQLNRNQKKEKYELDLESLLAGAKAEDIQIEHYITHLD